MELSESLFSSRISQSSFAVGLESYGKSPQVLPPNHVYGPILESSYLLQYCMEGCGIIEVDGRKIPLKKGDCVVTFPGQLRLELADSQDPWAFIWISLHGESAETFFARMGLTPQNPVLRNCEATLIPEKMEQIVNTADEVGFQGDFLLGSKILQFFDECLRAHPESTKQKKPLQRPCEVYVEQAAYYLNMHYSRDTLTIASLARQLGLNRSYLCEIFKQIKGVPPQEYLTKLRIEKACALLRISQVSVTSAACSVGYEPSVFSKAFKRAMGMTPREYKQQYSEK